MSVANEANEIYQERVGGETEEEVEVEEEKEEFSNEEILEMFREHDKVTKLQMGIMRQQNEIMQKYQNHTQVIFNQMNTRNVRPRLSENEGINFQEIARQAEEALPIVMGAAQQLGQQVLNDFMNSFSSSTTTSGPITTSDFEFIFPRVPPHIPSIYELENEGRIEKSTYQIASEKPLPPINTTCPITLTTFLPTDLIYQLRGCNHAFCAREFEEYIRRGVIICPNCRAVI